jgi:PhoPQ-activated pathogenicity-related protein
LAAEVRQTLFALIALVGAQAAAAQTAPTIAPADALAAYVAKPDDAFEWHVQRRYTNPDGAVVELHLESQRWQGEPWKHQLLLIRPKRVDDDHRALFIIGGGRWRAEYDTETGEEPLPEDGELFVAMARVLHTNVVVLGQVPYQPLFGMTEDRLIAHTFERYLATHDPEWPLLLPMVKSVVRAFDASSAFAQQEFGTSLDRFTVIGGSKRGWTTWLTAAVDPRVTAIAPIVIDALNMERHFPHQSQAWGAPSESIRPYTDLGLDRILASAEGEDLRTIVDPYSYRDKITQPKIVMLATNDQYFPLDSANLYFDGLRGPKWLLYLPNEPHSVKHYGPVVRALRALHEAAGGGKRMPRVDWEYDTNDDGLALCVRAEGARGLRIWRAVSADRDFRDAQWQSVVDTRRGRGRFELERPAEGYVAMFGEVRYGAALQAFALSTGLAVVAAAGNPPYGTDPLSTGSVCSTLEGTAAVPVPNKEFPLVPEE